MHLCGRTNDRLLLLPPLSGCFVVPCSVAASRQRLHFLRSGRRHAAALLLSPTQPGTPFWFVADLGRRAATATANEYHQQRVWQSNWWPSPPPKTRGYPAEDPSIVGVLLPLRQFAGFWDLAPADAAAAAAGAARDGDDDDDDNEELPHTPAAVAERLLSAARGLEIVRRQEPVVDDTTGQQYQPQSLLYDYGLMSAGLIECTAPHMCDYCHSPHIGQRRRERCVPVYASLDGIIVDRRRQRPSHGVAGVPDRHGAVAVARRLGVEAFIAEIEKEEVHNNVSF